jgi:hypothetical protein
MCREGRSLTCRVGLEHQQDARANAKKDVSPRLATNWLQAKHFPIELLGLRQIVSVYRRLDEVSDSRGHAFVS